MSLLAPMFLAGLLAIGLPLWLHRLSSDNPNKQRFSSLMFLEPGEPRRVLAKKLQYLLLLALRIGVLALLAFAFAQPAIWRVPQPGDQSGARLHVIVPPAGQPHRDQAPWQARRRCRPFRSARRHRHIYRRDYGLPCRYWSRRSPDTAQKY